MFSNIGFAFNLIMILVYAAAGIILIFVWQIPGLPDINNTIAGIVLFLYSVFRAYKLIRLNRDSNEGKS
ncbi:MAG: hypothetical protein DWQ44_05110 [Bacteroidetes bacterium]|nr:MAG: hypothetical protein DWQ33_11755 [Bacteroidota bacterium]REK00755.1 MAG: hypothetical protein DWQ39_11430 [Bacteroidota bacterium]REK35003.1 MAG: hypothetical protein DWQ44_05110 [Bacteroidota bacterium]REK48199.1 MAG: hypothetical protein DWQ48_10235 [Bacteroidota bacterium]